MTPRLTARTIIASVLTLAAIATMVSLGFWQLDRMHQKQQRLASIAQKSQQGALNLDALQSTHGDLRDIPVSFNGTPEGEHILLLDNQVSKGQVGFDVVLPVSTNAGWVLVNFGWVSANRYRDNLPSIDIASQVQVFTGVVAVPARNPLITETAQPSGQFPLVVQQLDPAVISQLIGKSLAPFIVQLTAPQDERFVRNWQPVVMPPEKHLAYAIQWFGLAIAALIVWFVIMFKKRSSHE